MKISTIIPYLLLSWIDLSSTAPLVPRQGNPGDSLVRKVYQFPNETWVENLAVRANGKILVTLIQRPELWEIDPFSKPTTAELVYRFPNAVSLLGITEYTPDVFGVNVGNFSDKTSTSKKGSWSVWSVDMRAHQESHENYPGGRHHGPKHGSEVHKITDIPEAKFLNGMTALPKAPATILLADSGAGLIYRLDTTTGAYSVAIDEPALKPNASGVVSLGVNGIHLRPGDEDHIYFTNTFKSPQFSRIPIDPATGIQTGPAETIVKSFADLGGAPDDFSFDSAGDAAYIANGALDGLVKVDVPSGAVKVVLGGTVRSKVVGQTACHFGRTKEDVKKGTLYITDTGGIAAPPPRGIVGGAVFALNTAEL